MRTHVFVFLYKQLLATLLHFGSLSCRVERGDSLYILNVEAKISVFRFMDCHVKLDVSFHLLLYTQNALGVQLLLVELSVSVACVRHIREGKLDRRPVPMRNHDEPLEQVARHHVIRMNIENETVTAGPHTHLQTEVVTEIQWGFEYGRSECTERLLSQNGSRNSRRQFDRSRKAP